ncbi:MAG: DUF4097 domain-containing protein [Terriglobia bacterium]
MRYVKLAWLSVVLVLALADASASGSPQEIWTMCYPLPAGGRVTVVNVQGSIRVEGWDRSEVELTVGKSVAGVDGRLAGVNIEVERGADWLRVRTLYPEESVEPVRVDYYLRVPRQVRLEGLHTVNGDIRVRNLEGRVEARTLNGDIEQRGIAGSVVARTLNGSIRVALRALPEPDGELRLETVNGDLNLLLPAEPNAELEASTVAGRIYSDFFSVAGGPGGDTALRTQLGRGGLRVRLRTIRGNIRVAQTEDVL